LIAIIRGCLGSGVVVKVVVLAVPVVIFGVVVGVVDSTALNVLVVSSTLMSVMQTISILMKKCT